MRAVRGSAQQGDIFTTDASAIIHRLLNAVFSAPDGTQVLASIADIPVERVVLIVNAEYPIDVPLATMPPQVLQTLPALPAGLDSRFVDRALILLDTRTRLIIDFIDDVLPR